VTFTADDQSPERLTLKEGAVISSDVKQEKRFVYHDFMKEHGVRAFVNVLILSSHGRPPFGVLQVDSREPRNFTQPDNVKGPSVQIPPRMALALAMAFQELATNAVKYGALSNEVGQINLHWSLNNMASPHRLQFTWNEVEGPPVQKPKRRGFGTHLIERNSMQDLDGVVRIEFAPDGVVCSVDAPLMG
jgi:hypothetical protein